MEAMILQLAAAAGGFFVGTFLFSRVGSWIQAIATAVKATRRPAAIALAALLNSGPWLLAGVLFLANGILSSAHSPAWDWFFAALAAAVPVWLAVSVYLYRRGRRKVTSS